MDYMVAQRVTNTSPLRGVLEVISKTPLDNEKRPLFRNAVVQPNASSLGVETSDILIDWDALGDVGTMLACKIFHRGDFVA